MAGVETLHEDYTEYQEFWKTMRDCFKGQSAIHKEGERYLPKLGGQSPADYKKYKHRALFYNATRRTVDAMVGMMFRKDPSYEATASIDDILNNVDLNGTSLFTFAQKCAREICLVNRAIVLVEFNQYDSPALTRAQAEAENRRPYLCMYKSENLVNWRCESINGQDVLVLAVLKEEHYTPKDEFSMEEVTKYRVLSLEDGRYVQRIWSKPENQKDYEVEAESVPLRNNAPIPYIPLYIYGVQGQEIEPATPPLYDLATVNLSHYMTSADLEHGAHYAGLPTAVISGHTPQEGETFEIGSATAWVFSDPNAKANYLEFTGQGLEALEKRMEKKEAQMAALGARMLAPEKRVAETVETETLRRGGEYSILAAIAMSVSELITESMKDLLLWAGIQTDFEYQVNRDFIPTKMTPQELTSWVSALQSGAVSQETFFEALQDGEMVKDSLTYEEEQDRISMGPVNLPNA